MNLFWAITILLVLSSFSAETEGRRRKPKEDYWWEDYKGAIPRYALTGGKDEKGKALYIGRAPLYDDDEGPLVPGYIDQQYRTLLIALNGTVHPVTQNIKVLCTCNPNKMQWILSDGNQIRLKNYNRYILGGYDEGGLENGYPLLIARKVWNRGTFVGNARVNKAKPPMSFAIDRSSFQGTESSFHLLTFQPC